MIVDVEDERRFAADSDSGTLADSESGSAAADKKVADRNIGVWASGCNLVVGL